MLEEVNRQSSVNISVLPVPQVDKMSSLFLVNTTKVTVLKNLYSLYTHVIRPYRQKNKAFLPPQ